MTKPRKKPATGLAARRSELDLRSVLAELKMIDGHMRSVDSSCWEKPNCPCCAMSSLITRLEVQIGSEPAMTEKR